MASVPKLSAILMASGRSSRFGENKLLASFQGRPIIETVLDTLPSELFHQVLVVTRFAEVAVSAAKRRFTVIENLTDGGDSSQTIRLGIEALPPHMDGCMFLVCDQPLLRTKTIVKLVTEFLVTPEHIIAPSFEGKRGNPVIFPSVLFAELAGLSEGNSGASVISAHSDRLRLVEISDQQELRDVDLQSDLAEIKTIAL